MKKIVKMLLAMVMTLSLAACGDSGSEKTEITFWSTNLIEGYDVLLKEFVEEYNASQDEVQVNLEILTYEGVTEKLQIALTNDATPDIFLDGTARTASLPALGKLEPVDDIFDSFDNWKESLMSIGVIEDTHYLVPMSTINGCSISVNVTLAKELGVYDMLPEDKYSWNIHDLYDFIEASAKAGEEKGIKGTYLYAGSSTSDDILYSLMLSNGATIIDFDTMTSKANSKEAVEVIQVLSDIVKNGYAMEGATTLTGGDAISPFVNRKIVTCINIAGSGLISNFELMVKDGYAESVDEIVTYAVPHADGLDSVSASWGANCFAVFTNEGDQAKISAAKEFIKAYLNDEEMAQKVWNTNGAYSPSRTIDIQYQNENEFATNSVEYHSELTAKYGNSSFGILESYWPEVRNSFYPELQAVYAGQKTAQEAMDSFAQKVNDILADQK